MALPEVQRPASADASLDVALTAAVREAGPAGASLEALWHAAFAVEPELASSPERRHRLSAAIERLVAGGVARSLPGRSGAYERSAHPPLPLVVRPVAAARNEKVAVTLPGDLRPELAGARNLERIRRDEVVTLEAVNAFLRDWSPNRPEVPARERSLEIFGDEKRLDALRSTRLFGTGVLSLELLHCYEVHPPFVYERVGDAPVALVIENHHTYDSARRVLSGADRGIGFVVYGAGRAFEASVTYLADLGATVERVAYFGDLDSAGLSIPVGASATWEQAGGSAIEPAGPLYRALLTTRVRRAGTVIADGGARQLVAWLPADLQEAARATLAAGLWIPQEAVGLEVLGALANWLD